MKDTDLMVCLSISLNLPLSISVSQYLLDLSSYLILISGSSLYLCISLSLNRFNKPSTFMVWVLDDEEGVWLWSVFWRNGEVEQGTNLEGLRALSFSLYLCFFFFGVLEHFNRSFFFFFERLSNGAKLC